MPFYDVDTILLDQEFKLKSSIKRKGLLSQNFRNIEWDKTD